MKIIKFSVRHFLPMFWHMQNQNNPIGSQVAHPRRGPAHRGQRGEAAGVAELSNQGIADENR
jgi:hypothetical protein